MPAITDADGHVAFITPDGRLYVTVDGSITATDIYVKRSSDGARINPATEETLITLEAKDFATEVTLAALAAKDFSTEVTLASLLAAYLERVPKNVKQYADGLYRSGGGSQAVGSGGTGFIQISNPVGSGINLTIVEFDIAMSIDGTVEFWLDRTLTLPTSENVWMPNRLYEGVAVTKGEIKRATAATGGTQLSPESRMEQNIHVHRDFVSTLAPGQSISIQASSGVLEAFTLFASATWIEEAI